METIYLRLADCILVIHFLFILFVVTGGLVVLRWPRSAWLHVPAALWGALVEFMGWPCPLTPLENHFRSLGGGSEYHRDFIIQYLMPIIYPGNLTFNLQLVFGLSVVAINGLIYGFILYHRKPR